MGNAKASLPREGRAGPTLFSAQCTIYSKEILLIRRFTSASVLSIAVSGAGYLAWRLFWVGWLGLFVVGW